MISIVNPSQIVLKPVKVTFFEMHEPPIEKLVIRTEVKFRLLEKPIAPDDYLFYYSEVGKQHFWLDRLVMSKDALSDLINAANIEIYTMHVNDKPAGYAEFIIEKKFTEILYFGIMPDFIGRSLGKYALDWAIQHAWSYNPEWIQLNTCELDHPHAIHNYRKRGFKEVRTEIHQRKVIES
ncbi:MAG: GNAT family N-acetyltransferase [Chitinophagaceae bacterium]